MVVIPRTYILSAFAPGALLLRVTINPGMVPCKAVEREVVLRAATSAPPTEPTAPVKSFFLQLTATDAGI